jgi:hypothetical protein
VGRLLLEYNLYLKNIMNWLFKINNQFFFMKNFIFILLLLLYFSCAKSQNLARINGQMIIKEKSADGKFSISSGTFYYDTKIKKLIYNLIFPNKITWVAKDTTLFKFENGIVVQKIRNYALPEFSIFHLALFGNLNDYGLSKSGYKISSTEKLKDNVYITYTPDKSYKGMGKVIIDQKNGLLQGIVFYNSKNVIINKQFFNKYKNEKGIAYPMEVINIAIINNKELYQVTTYNKISINDFNDTKNFDIKLPNKY